MEESFKSQASSSRENSKFKAPNFPGRFRWRYVIRLFGETRVLHLLTAALDAGEALVRDLRVNLFFGFLHAGACVRVAGAVEVGFAGEFLHQGECQRAQCHRTERFGLSEGVIGQPVRWSFAKVGGFFARDEENPFTEAHE